LLHVLPKRFVRIRHYGLLAGRNVSTRLARGRHLLGAPRAAVAEKTWLDRLAAWMEETLMVCPRCQELLRRRPLAETSVMPVGCPGPIEPVAGVDSS
jgi:hypothetical protein